MTVISFQYKDWVSHLKQEALRLGTKLELDLVRQPPRRVQHGLEHGKRAVVVFHVCQNSLKVGKRVVPGHRAERLRGCVHYTIETQQRLTSMTRSRDTILSQENKNGSIRTIVTSDPQLKYLLVDHGVVADEHVNGRLWERHNVRSFKLHGF
jgi:hypothetical protein